jgi:hypothetical protein
MTKVVYICHPFRGEITANREHGLALLRGTDEMWVCADGVSEGMAGEIAEARRLSVPVYRIDVGRLLSWVGRERMDPAPMGYAYRLPPPR